MLVEIPEQDGGCVAIDFENEAKVLDVIYGLGIPWGFRCAACEVEITSETQWKPHALIGFLNRRVNQVTFALYCGECGKRSPAIDR